MKVGYKSGRRRACDKVLVDEIDAVLGMILKAHIEMATLTPDSLIKKENDIMTIGTTSATKATDAAANSANASVNSASLRWSNVGVTATFKPDTSVKLFNINTKVKDVNVIVSNKVVEVLFADGTKEKAVCREPDVFSLEQAIAICIGKKIMGGSSAYNNAIKRGLKVYEDKITKKALDKLEQERIEKKRAKKIAYKKRKAAEREQAEKERQIEIQKEAYIRATRELGRSTV